MHNDAIFDREKEVMNDLNVCTSLCLTVDHVKLLDHLFTVISTSGKIGNYISILEFYAVGGSSRVG
jgi:hypothetical protein